MTNMPGRQVTWPAEKDRELWRILSQGPPGRQGTSSEAEWKRLAAQFDVSLAFILQQAAWLYERQLSQVRAQMRKVGGGRPLSGNYSAAGMPGGGGSLSGSPNPAAGGGGGSTVQTSPRPASSSLATRGFDTGHEVGTSPSGRGRRPSTLSRIPSTATVTQSRQMPGVRVESAQNSSRRGISRDSQAAGHQREAAGGASPAAPDPFLSAQPQETEVEEAGGGDNLETSSSESDDDADDNEKSMPAKSLVFRRQLQQRRGRFNKAARHTEDEDDEDAEEDDDAPAFLPFSETGSAGLEQQDLGATVRTADDGSKASSNAIAAASLDNKGKQKEADTASSNMSTASSATSSAGPLATGELLQGRRAAAAAAASPRHRTELAGRAGNKREGSEGTPSMGSSFSDLEDTSVTQSAMEEYYLSKMQHGAASRMSTFSQALKSKYLPQQQQQQQQHQR